MLSQGLRVIPRAQLMQQPGRTLDVGEEKRNRAAGEIAHSEEDPAFLVAIPESPPTRADLSRHRLGMQASAPGGVRSVRPVGWRRRICDRALPPATDRCNLRLLQLMRRRVAAPRARAANAFTALVRLSARSLAATRGGSRRRHAAGPRRAESWVVRAPRGHAR